MEEHSTEKVGIQRSVQRLRAQNIRIAPGQGFGFLNVSRHKASVDQGVQQSGPTPNIAIAPPSLRPCIAPVNRKRSP
nr:hypothetical protein [Novosphingobium sp. THN1]